MSSRQQITKAMKRAETRDRKRRTKMKVSGKGVLTLQQLMGRRAK